MPRAQAVAVARRLQDAGFIALFAGGCVRDRLLGLDPEDYDVATSAVPDEVESLFTNSTTVSVGRRFGVVIVALQGASIEVATFRTDLEYVDGRRPTGVTFTDARGDAQRRDFTINAMFEDPVSGQLFDYVGGRDDLDARLIRAVGDPHARFEEDQLRLLRAVRFAARLGFSIQADTLHAIRANAASVATVSAERVGDEILRILCQGGARRGFELLDETALLEHVLPEMLTMKGCGQSVEFHPEGDVFEHTLRCIGYLQADCTPSLALGVLLHDIAKPECAVAREGRHTFHGHAERGATRARAICRRLRRSNAIGERVELLVAQHLRHYDAVRMRPSTLKRFLRQDGIEELLDVARIDALGSSGDLTHYQFCVDALRDLPPIQIRPPRLLDGDDLIAMGLEPGPRFKEILTIVEDAQLEGTVTTREEATALVHSSLADSSLADSSLADASD